jgi:hypothetical protein
MAHPMPRTEQVAREYQQPSPPLGEPSRTPDESTAITTALA